MYIMKSMSSTSTLCADHDEVHQPTRSPDGNLVEVAMTTSTTRRQDANHDLMSHGNTNVPHVV
eukprot:CAMPEP_0197071730 /NCGR_PEP_ID=MMETSP1384-20130603/208593_1 /TAXON_ID=29189 /ORGANISM="Ammonia sp." /LENGTH=62 /DNA_ID=CAMNT_0042510481 /DNA_START=126 /DNA_END=311 /DNA_ORIENTATION=-